MYLRLVNCTLKNSYDGKRCVYFTILKNLMEKIKWNNKKKLDPKEERKKGKWEQNPDRTKRRQQDYRCK